MTTENSLYTMLIACIFSTADLLLLLGTIFVSTTMSVQDDDATINCVCVVIRTHMLDAAKENIEPLPQYDIFRDVPSSSQNAVVNQQVLTCLFSLRSYLS